MFGLDHGWLVKPTILPSRQPFLTQSDQGRDEAQKQGLRGLYMQMLGEISSIGGSTTHAALELKMSSR
jgi:hypothetical protein